MASLYLKLLYMFYPPWLSFPEYSLARAVAKRYGCREVLDVGCGYGNLFKILEDQLVTYVGIDIENTFRIKNPKATFVVADALSPPPWILSQRFDCVFFVNSLFYISTDALGLYGGLGEYVVVIDIEPKPIYLHAYLFDLLEGGLRKTVDELVGVAEGMGFQVVDVLRKRATYCLVLRKQGVR